MANKKTAKNRKKPKLKKSSAHTRHAAKKAASKKPVARKAAPKKKAASKKVAASKKAAGRNTTPRISKLTEPKEQIRSDDQIVDTPFLPRESRARSAGQSGDLQGLSSVGEADSESVDELLEEGNAFEADAVAGVEDAGNFEGREVHTHEVPEDDVPGEYLDEE